MFGKVMSIPDAVDAQLRRPGDTLDVRTRSSDKFSRLEAGNITPARPQDAAGLRDRRDLPGAEKRRTLPQNHFRTVFQERELPADMPELALARALHHHRYPAVAEHGAQQERSSPAGAAGWRQAGRRARGRCSIDDRSRRGAHPPDRTQKVPAASRLVVAGAGINPGPPAARQERPTPGPLDSPKPAGFGDHSCLCYSRLRPLSPSAIG